MLPIGSAIGGDHESARPQLEQAVEHGIEVSFSTGMQDMELQPEDAAAAGRFLNCESGSGTPMWAPQTCKRYDRSQLRFRVI
jgi:hypothetical protein